MHEEPLQPLRPGIACDVEAGESLTITPSMPGQAVQVHVVEKSGRRTRLRIQSRDPVLIERKKTEQQG